MPASPSSISLPQPWQSLAARVVSADRLTQVQFITPHQELENAPLGEVFETLRQNDLAVEFVLDKFGKVVGGDNLTWWFGRLWFGVTMP